MKPYFKFFWPGILTLPAGGLFVLGLLTFGPRQPSDMFYQRALIGGMLIALGSFAFWKAIEFVNAAHGSHTVRAIFAALAAAVLILHGEFYILWPDWKLIQNPLAFSFHGPGKASWNLPNAVLVSSNASDIDGTYTVGNQKLSFDTLDKSRSCPIILDREGNADRETPLLRSSLDDNDKHTECECPRRVLHKPRTPSAFSVLIFLLVTGAVTFGLFYGLCRWVGLLPTPGDRSRRGDLNG